MALTDITSLLLKQPNPAQQALIQKLNIPADQVLTHTEFINLIVRPIMELQDYVNEYPTGKSAFDLAVEQGFTGTVSEWLATLVGPAGDTTECENIVSTIRDEIQAMVESPDTDAALVAKVAEHSATISELGTKVGSNTKRIVQLESGASAILNKTQEDGFFVVDADGNIGFTANPLDVGSFSDHVKQMIKAIGGGLVLGTTDGTAYEGSKGYSLETTVKTNSSTLRGMQTVVSKFSATEESGFYVVDENGYIGWSTNNTSKDEHTFNLIRAFNII